MSIKINNIEKFQEITSDQKNKAIAFKSEPIPQDTVELSNKEKKKKLSIAAKIGIGIGATIFCVVGTMYAISKHQMYKLNKLYKEKLIPKIFDKKINFTEAKTKEEALKFAKDTLGVQNINEEMTLDALNYANRGITDVVNKNIGQEVFIVIGEDLNKEKINDLFMS